MSRSLVIVSLMSMLGSSSVAQAGAAGDRGLIDRIRAFVAGKAQLGGPTGIAVHDMKGGQPLGTLKAGEPQGRMFWGNVFHPRSNPKATAVDVVESAHYYDTAGVNRTGKDREPAATVHVGNSLLLPIPKGAQVEQINVNQGVDLTIGRARIRGSDYAVVRLNSLPAPTGSVELAVKHAGKTAEFKYAASDQAPRYAPAQITRIGKLWGLKGFAASLFHKLQGGKETIEARWVDGKTTDVTHKLQRGGSGGSFSLYLDPKLNPNNEHWIVNDPLK